MPVCNEALPEGLQSWASIFSVVQCGSQVYLKFVSILCSVDYDKTLSVHNLYWRTLCCLDISLRIPTRLELRLHNDTCICESIRKIRENFNTFQRLNHFSFSSWGKTSFPLSHSHFYRCRKCCVSFLLPCHKSKLLCEQKMQYNKAMYIFLMNLMLKSAYYHNRISQ